MRSSLVHPSFYRRPSIKELRGKPLFDQLFQQLETPYAVYILRRMDYADLEEFSQLMKQAIDSRKYRYPKYHPGVPGPERTEGDL